jgi:tRNA (guanine-N7-)-methyltransferase
MGRRFQAFRPPEGLPPRPWLDPSRPLDLEIGCGAGLHPIQYARAHLDRQILAIEHSKTRFKRLQGRVCHHPDLTHLYPIHANAISWVSYQLKEREIDRCFLLYPNPFPKQKHRNLRWHNMPFFGELLSKLKINATFHLATNEAWYMEEACEVLRSRWGMQLLKLQQLHRTDMAAARTHFERKYLERGEVCFDAIFSLYSL